MRLRGALLMCVVGLVLRPWTATVLEMVTAMSCRRREEVQLMAMEGYPHTHMPAQP
jgi:hypothetical protein